MKSALLPRSAREKAHRTFSLTGLALLWLAAHAVLLAVILSLKFLTAKAIALLFLLGAVLWFLMGRRRPLLLPPPEMV